jgi:hypothetical protein
MSAGKRGFEKVAEMKQLFGGSITDEDIDPLIPRFRLIDEHTGKLIMRFALDRAYAPGEAIILPSIRIAMPS